MDIPALFLAIRTGLRIVTKRELLAVPIFGWALWLAGFPFIDRRDRERAIRSLDRASALFRRGISVLVFAEGTRSQDGRLLPFKKGGFVLALEAGVPIVPVAVRGGVSVLPKGSLCVRRGCIEVMFEAPVETRDYSLENKHLLIDEVRNRILQRLQGPGASKALGLRRLPLPVSAPRTT
jgi:1-acyl-sn-glycerol-3-phosphate acyltransferase